MGVFIGCAEYKRSFFSRSAGGLLLDQPGVHKYRRPFVLAAVQDKILVGGYLFPVGVRGLHFQPVASRRQLAEYGR